MNILNGGPSPRVFSYPSVLPVGFQLNWPTDFKNLKSVTSKLSLFTADPFSKLSDKSRDGLGDRLQVDCWQSVFLSKF